MISTDAWCTLDDAAERSMAEHGHVTDAVAQTWLEFYAREIRAGLEPPHDVSSRLALFLSRGRGRACPKWRTHLRRARGLTKGSTVDVHPVRVADVWQVQA